MAVTIFRSITMEFVNFVHHSQEHNLEISVDLILVPMVKILTLLVNVVTLTLNQIILLHMIQQMFLELVATLSKLQAQTVLDVKPVHHTLVPSKMELFVQQTIVLQIQL